MPTTRLGKKLIFTHTIEPVMGPWNYTKRSVE